MSPGNKETPFNELPNLPPNVELETKEVLKKCITARVALEGLRQAVSLIPNQELLLYTIPVLEAQASSAIENIVTTADTLFRSLEAEDRVDPMTKEALRYRIAIFKGLDTLKKCPVSARTALTVCSALRGTNVDFRSMPGTYIGNTTTQSIVYTPPEGKEVIAEKLRNWAEFLNTATELDPLIRLAVAHYQFEAIHPFSDGNGRTGRILNILYLVSAGLLDKPILYLSEYLIANKSEYYTRLLAVTECGDWSRWILFMLEAIESTANKTREKVLAISKLQQQVEEQIKGNPRLKKIYSAELLDLIFTMPYVRIQNLVAKKIASRQTAAKYFTELTACGILREVAQPKTRLFVNENLLKVLGRKEPSKGA